MIKRFPFICTLLIICSCGNEYRKPDNNIITYSLVDNVAFQKEIGLKEFVRDIEYTKLEFKPQCIIGNVNDLKASDDYFFISTFDNFKFKLYKFKQSGEFVQEIGKHGKGPGEYSDISDFELVEEMIFVLSNLSNQILIYNFDGTYNRSIRIENRNYNSFNYLGNGILALQSGLYIDDVVLAELIDLHGNILNKFKSKVFNSPDKKFDGKLYNIVYKYNDEFFVKESKNDTVYKITTSKLVPHFVYELGKFNQPTECPEQEWYRYYVIYRIIETKDYIFTFFTYDNSGCIAKHNKTNCKVVVSIPEDKLKYGIKNDFDYGHDFALNLWTAHIANQHEWLLPLTANELAGFVNQRNLSGNFKNLMSHFDPNDNPIIMKMILK